MNSNPRSKRLLPLLQAVSLASAFAGPVCAQTPPSSNPSPEVQQLDDAPGGTPQAPETAQPPAAGFWDDDIWRNPDRGFYWYPDPQQPPVKDQRKPEAAAKPKPPLQQVQDMAQIRKELERLFNVAVINPSEQNVLNYLRAQKWMVDKADVFQGVWQRALLKYPDVDANAVIPSSQFATTAMKNQYTVDREQLLKGLGKTHGVVFFARSDCAQCHLQAPVVRMLTQRYGIEVLAITMDRRPIPQFPDARPDNGISFQVSGGAGVTSVPQLFLVSRDQKEIYPLGAGVMTLEDIAERIRLQTVTTPTNAFEKTWSVTR
jgi:conjugal transfer pilus assembly protein TraF